MEIDPTARELCITGNLVVKVPKRWVEEAIKIAMTRRQIGAEEGIEGIFDSMGKVFNTVSSVTSNPLVKMAMGFIPGGGTITSGIEAIGMARKVAQNIKNKIPRKTRKLLSAVSKQDPSALQVVRALPPREKMAVSEALQLERDYEALDEAERHITSFDRIVEFQ